MPFFVGNYPCLGPAIRAKTRITFRTDGRAKARMKILRIGQYFLIDRTCTEKCAISRSVSEGNPLPCSLLWRFRIQVPRHANWRFAGRLFGRTSERLWVARIFAGGSFVRTVFLLDVLGETLCFQLVVALEILRDCHLRMRTGDEGGHDDALDRLTGFGAMRERGVVNSLAKLESFARCAVVANGLVNVNRHRQCSSKSVV